MNLKQVWYSPKADIESPDTIHQVLMYGALEDIKSLKRSLGIETIKKLFLKYPKKIYTSSALHFIKDIILNIATPIDEQKYLKSTPRNTR